MTVHIQTQLVINRGHGPQITIGFSFFLFPLSERNIRQKTSVYLDDHKASDSNLDLEYHKSSDSDSDLEDHKVSNSDSNISIFCYGFRYAPANPVF